MKKVLIIGLLLNTMLAASWGQTSNPYISEGTYRKFLVRTESFESFMGAKFDSGMRAIRNINVRSEAEAVLVVNSSGASLVYTERTIFQPRAHQMIIFGPAWGPMQGRYPIEMWKELVERSGERIRQWITGGEGEGTTHGQRDGDLGWIVETGFMGAGAASGWGFDTEVHYPIGNGATIHCAVGDSRSYVMTITIPLDVYIHDPVFFTPDGRDVRARISFCPVVSALMQTGKLFRTDTFTMQRQ